jgi:hypothetical protein
MVAKGADNYGVEPTPINLNLAQGYTNVEVALTKNAGAPPLTISRIDTDNNGQEDAIKINWLPDISEPQIFILTGNGTGQYTNAIDNWVKITTDPPAVWGIKNVDDLPGILKDPSNGNSSMIEMVDNNKGMRMLKQVGGDLNARRPEVYFKLLVKGAVPADTLPQALACGKFDVEVGPPVGPPDDSPERFFISVPLVQTDTTLQAVFGTQISDGDWLAEYDDQAKVTSGANRVNGAWQQIGAGGPDPKPLLTDILLGHCFGFHTANVGTKTFVGSVYNSDFASTLTGGPDSKPTWIANPFVKPINIAAAGLNQASFDADISKQSRVRQYRADAKTIGGVDGMAYHTAADKWMAYHNEGLVDSILELKPGRGYYFKDNVNLNIPWEITKPY